MKSKAREMASSLAIASKRMTSFMRQSQGVVGGSHVSNKPSVSEYSSASFISIDISISISIILSIDISIIIIKGRQSKFADSSSHLTCAMLLLLV
jgi:hypothetical protein